MKKQEKHINYKYKVLELFGGIGAPRVALDNLYGDCKLNQLIMLIFQIDLFMRITN